MDEKYRSRKFFLATSALLIASTAFFMGMMNATEWGLTTAGVLGLYNHSNVADKK